MDYIDRSEALRASLEALFNRYPVHNNCDEHAYQAALEHSQQISGTDLISSLVRWRDTALRKAAEGSSDEAFVWAIGTGVPDDELKTLKALLYG